MKDICLMMTDLDLSNEYGNCSLNVSSASLCWPHPPRVPEIQQQPSGDETSELVVVKQALLITTGKPPRAHTMSPVHSHHIRCLFFLS
jgi:hypothetical protein